MRRAVAAVSLVGAMLVLQGCGGGGGPSPSPAPSGPCMNANWDIVTQSSKMSTKVDASGSGAQGAGSTSGTIQGDAKIDFENFNVRIDETGTLNVLETKPSAANWDLKLDDRLILDASKKLLVIFSTEINASTGKQILHNCSAITISEMPTSGQLTMIWAVIKAKISKTAECKGNDGTYDTWHFSLVHHKGDPWNVPVPLPVKLPTDVELTVDDTLKMDKNYLLHSETLQVNAANGTYTAKVYTNTDVTDASSAGPTAADLDYSSFGTCTPIPKLDHQFLKDMLTIPKRQMSTAKKLVLLTLLAGLESEAKEVVV